MRFSPLFAAAVSAIQFPNSYTEVKNTFETKSSKKKTASDLKKAKKTCKLLVKQLMKEVGAPGMVVGVSINGVNLWSKGFGLSDVENSVPCQASTVMRVASISKAFTSLAMAKLWESGKLDLDKPIQKYVSDFPEKNFNNEKVTITLRQLLSHTSGIRHYSKNNEEDTDEFSLKEYYLTKPFKTVREALTLFQNDPLLNRPGEEYLYTTHGWTLVSAVLEKASGQDFLMLMCDLFRRMGMNSTVPDYHDMLVYGRARYYTRNKNGKLANSPYVDNSYKWAGGGFLSTVDDLLKFGNVMIYSYQQNDKSKPPAMLRSETVEQMWRPVVKPTRKRWTEVENKSYGLGWNVYHEMEPRGFCPDCRLEVFHTGDAVGASSVLFIVPGPQHLKGATPLKEGARGVVVAIMCNLQSVGLSNLARGIAREFEKFSEFRPVDLFSS